MVIGITGGVGCGKSTVLALLEREFGCAVIEADKTAHLLMQQGNSVYEKIVSVFGTEILQENGQIDRKKLGQIVFLEKEKLQILNKIVHPAVKQYIREWIQNMQSTQKERVIAVEAALLIEDHYREFCDELWYIYTDLDTRKKRLSESRGYTEEKTESIIKNQLSEKEFMEKCDRVIDNRGLPEDTRKQLAAFFQQIREV